MYSQKDDNEYKIYDKLRNGEYGRISSSGSMFGKYSTESIPSIHSGSSS